MVIEAKPRARTKKPGSNASNLPKSSSEYIKDIIQLKRKPRNDEALHILHKVASLVKPIMKKHGFKVGKLVEFCPKDNRLLGLNVNHGVKICIRLRPPGAADDGSSSFFPMEHVIGTMLHELTHNKFGPHDQKFYSYLDKLKEEYMELAAGGYTGEGFFSEGKVLGGNGHARASGIDEARRIALKAAERRAALGKNSGQKLGGGTSGGSLSLQELIRRAAEQRAIDNKWCPDPASIAQEDMGEDSDVEVLECKSRKRSGSQDRDLGKKVIVIEDEEVPTRSSTGAGSQRLDQEVIDLTGED